MDDKRVTPSAVFDIHSGLLSARFGFVPALMEGPGMGARRAEHVTP